MILKSVEETSYRKEEEAGKKIQNLASFFFRLYRERITQIESKLSEVRAGQAPEYLQPLEELQFNMKSRMEVGAVLRDLRLQNIKCKYDAEELAAQQNFEVSLQLVLVKSQAKERTLRFDYRG